MILATRQLFSVKLVVIRSLPRTGGRHLGCDVMKTKTKMAKIILSSPTTFVYLVDTCHCSALSAMVRGSSGTATGQ